MQVVDLHCDTILEIWMSELRGSRLSLRDTEASGRRLMLDLKMMAQGGYILQNFALFTNKRLKKGLSGPDAGWNNADSLTKDGEPAWDMWDQWKNLYRVFREEMEENADVIRQVRTFREIEENRAAGKMSALLTTEEGGIIEGRIERLQELYDAGVRMMTITWNYENELGFPNRPEPGFEEDFRKYYRFRPKKEEGLTATGKEAVAAMESLGIIPDVSHLSDAGFFDLADIVKGPFAASHSNARALCSCGRNLTDDMIRIIAEHGGIIGLNYAPAFVMEADREEDCFASCEGLARHARHIMDVGGAGVLALGSYFDGIDPVGLEMENASQVQRFAEYLETHGFTADEIEGIYYKNALRLYKDVLR